MALLLLLRSKIVLFWSLVLLFERTFSQMQNLKEKNWSDIPLQLKLHNLFVLQKMASFSIYYWKVLTRIEHHFQACLSPIIWFNHQVNHTDDNSIILAFVHKYWEKVEGIQLSLSQWDKFDNYKANLDDEWVEIETMENPLSCWVTRQKHTVLRFPLGIHFAALITWRISSYAS